MGQKTQAANESLKWVMRAGYGSRGVIYIIVGGLAMSAALWGGEAKGTTDALGTLRSQPWGVGALWAIGLGLMAYMIWRCVNAICDLDDHGADAAGLFARAGLVTTGVLHGAIGLSVIGLAQGSGGGGSGAEDWTAQVMQMPAGRWIVGLAAVIFAGAGVYYTHKGLTGSYKDHLQRSRLTQRLGALLTFGLVIQGLIIGLIGVSLGFAALNTSPDQAGGVGHALDAVRSVTWGRWLLGVVGFGLLAFALFNIIQAIYRIVPRITGTQVKSLAQKAGG